MTSPPCVRPPFLLATGLLALGLLGCGQGSSSQVEIFFASAEARERTTSMTVTAVEPFSTVQEFENRRVLVRCGQLGVFPATSARYDRSAADLEAIEQVLVNRVPRSYPLGDDWSFEIPALRSSKESNPWRAVLVHFEARGPGRDFSPTAADADEEKTLLESCFCMRLDEDATGGDPVLDAEVKANCLGVSQVESAPLAVELGPIVPPEFRLEPCGGTDLTSPGQQRLRLWPGVCLRTTRCTDAAPGETCFDCDRLCTALDDLSRVPIQVELVDPGPGTRLVGSGIVLTDVAGRVAPEIELGDCEADPLTVRLRILGRVDEAVELRVFCAPRSEPVPAAAPLLLAGEEIRMLSALPLEDGVSRLVSLSSEEDQNSALLRMYQVEAGRLVALPFEGALGAGLDPAVARFPDERPRGLAGFSYVVAGPNGPERPMLALVTSPSELGAAETRLRIFAYEEGALRLIRTSDGPCPVCTCNQQPICLAAGAPTCSCGFTDLPPSAAIQISAADLNGDGLADLSLAANSGVVLTTYYSAPGRNPEAVPMPPEPLEGSCTCTQYGKVLETFDLLQLGGKRDQPGLPAIDLVMGDSTGAYVRYAESLRLDGLPCTPGGASGCPEGQQCIAACADRPEDGRCLRPCADAASCVDEVMAPSCGGEIGATNYCIGPVRGCGQPTSVWRLIIVRDLARGRFGDGVYEDTIGVAAGMAGIGFDAAAKVRVFYGAPLDLAEIDAETPAVRDRSALDLVPRWRERGPPSSPRAVDVADFNGDGSDDAAVLFGGSEEVRLWFGSGHRGLGELSTEVDLRALVQTRCETSCSDDTCREGCAREACLEPRLVGGNFDGDPLGRADFVVACERSVNDQAGVDSDLWLIRMTDAR